MNIETLDNMLMMMEDFKEMLGKEPKPPTDLCKHRWRVICNQHYILHALLYTEREILRQIADGDVVYVPADDSDE